jgi:hypothetical protein
VVCKTIKIDRSPAEDASQANALLNTDIYECFAWITIKLNNRNKSFLLSHNFFPISKPSLLRLLTLHFGFLFFPLDRQHIEEDNEDNESELWHEVQALHELPAVFTLQYDEIGGVVTKL